MEEKSQIEMAKVDAFDVPKEEVDTFVEDREFCAEEAKKVMALYCPVVKREVIDPVEGEAIISYFASGEEAFKVLLDPFEVPVMKIAFERGRLKEYILAANGLTEEEAEYLSKQPKESQ